MTQYVLLCQKELNTVSALPPRGSVLRLVTGKQTAQASPVLLVRGQGGSDGVPRRTRDEIGPARGSAVLLVTRKHRLTAHVESIKDIAYIPHVTCIVPTVCVVHMYIYHMYSIANVYRAYIHTLDRPSLSCFPHTRAAPTSAHPHSVHPGKHRTHGTFCHMHMDSAPRPPDAHRRAAPTSAPSHAHAHSYA